MADEIVCLNCGGKPTAYEDLCTICASRLIARLKNPNNLAILFDIPEGEFMHEYNQQYAILERAKLTQKRNELAKETVIYRIEKNGEMFYTNANRAFTLTGKSALYLLSASGREVCTCVNGNCQLEEIDEWEKL